MKEGEGMGGRLSWSDSRISAEMVVEITFQTLSASGCDEKR